MNIPFIDASETGSGHVDGLSIHVVDENGQKNDPLGTPQGVILHWSAGTYTQCFNAYHFNIVYNPETKHASVVRTLNWKMKGQHLWGRNTGMVGISFCAMADANPPASMSAPAHFGSHPVTDAQVEAAAVLVAEICAWKHLDPSGTITVPQKRISGDSLINTGSTIQAPVVTDHRFYAQHDGYAADRWDIERYMAQVYTKANQYYKELKAHTRQFQFEPLLK